MTDSSTYNEHELLLGIADGNEQAFKRVHDHYWENLYPVALGFLKSPDLALDTLQEVFIKVWNNRQMLPEVKDFSAYLFVAVRNTIISQLRKQQRRSAHYHLYSQQMERYFSEADDKIRIDEMQSVVSQTIRQLPDLQQKVLELSRHQGLSHAEIALLLGIDKKAVTNAITRALNHIRTAIKLEDDTLMLAILGAGWILFA